MTTDALTYDPADPSTVEDPYPVFARLRDEAPVHFSPAMGVWVLTRYDDVTAALRRHQQFSSTALGGGMMGGRFLIGSDPPDHTTLRRIVGRHFTPTATSALEPYVREVCGRLVDDLLDAGRSGPVDLAEMVAVPLPVTVIAHVLGIEPERWQDFKRWSDSMMGGMTPDFQDGQRVSDMVEMFQYFAETIEARRKQPGSDLISVLVGTDEELTDHELGMFCMLLLIAGNETTTNLVGNAAVALFDHPDQAALVAGDPSLIPDAIEEALRYDAPVQGLARRTIGDVEIGGTTIPDGSMVGVLYGAANRDPRKFADPDRFDVTRKAADHLAFGAGIHHCLGAPLARLEARVLAETMLERVAHIAPAGRPERIHNMIVRGVRSFPVNVEARRAG